MSDSDSKPEPAWRPLSALQRRALGVLVEKAKTTPEQYPLTLNSLRNGCNQKSNRFPQMQIEAERLAETLDELRELGAVTEIQDSGRTAKFRHRLYEWLGVEKVEMAVMAELLLRGAQTIGELRGRAARMEPIADLAALRPVLESLAAKKLIVYLTPQGRGCVLTHNLYERSELQRLQNEHGGASPSPVPAPPTPSSASAAPAAPPSPAPAAPVAGSGGDTAALRREVIALQQEVSQLKSELAELRQESESSTESLRSDLDAIARDLGV
jgi:hypothetical protein